MLERLRRHLTYANVMATLAVFMVLGGTSYAAVKLSRGQVKTKHLANGSVTSAKVKNGSLLRNDFKAGQLPAGAPGQTGQTGPTGPKGDKGDQGPAGPSEARSVHHMSGGPTISSSSTTVATLSDLAPGSYFITSKVSVFTGTNQVSLIACFLDAGDSQDRAEGAVGNTAGGTIDLELVNHLTHTFTTTGTATLSCINDNLASTVATNGIRLTAVRLGSQTSTAF